MPATVDIDDYVVGGGRACIVAEIGVNHNGDLGLAARLVDAAAAAGADAVKFQVFSAERLATATAATAAYQEAGTGAETQRELLEGLELSADELATLARRARARGLLLRATPFDVGAVELLDRLDVAAFKVSSGDLTNSPLLAEVARRRRPIVLSTGMATLDEVEEAVSYLEAAGESRVIVLHCVSAYPAAPRDANLRAMATIRSRLGVPVGFSDHTLGTDVALAATALEAAMLEKHLTLDCNLPGPDHKASLEPNAFAELVRGVREVESALGDGVKRPAPVELETRAVVRRSLAAARDLAAGTVLEQELLVPLRPGTGISPTRIDEVVGRVVVRAVGAGELIDPADLA
jgi:N-acetylneuraminate synthase/N,N'-diacetyllegionaminate synthase